jgi:hypothetical protein
MNNNFTFLKVFDTDFISTISTSTMSSTSTSSMVDELTALPYHDYAVLFVLLSSKSMYIIVMIQMYTDQYGI